MHHEFGITIKSREIFRFRESFREIISFCETKLCEISQKLAHFSENCIFISTLISIH
jgi:hypothetical protein